MQSFIGNSAVKGWFPA